MFIKNADYAQKVNVNMKGGDGSVTVRSGIADIKIPHSRMAAELCLPPKSSIGGHVHEAEAEIFYVVSGVGRVVDDETSHVFCPGDMHVCLPGHFHQLINDGDGDLKVLAVIVTDAE